jgi:hypothetical protein
MYKLNQISIDTPKTLTEVKNEYVRVTMWDKFVHYLEKQSHEIVKKWDLFKNSNGNGPQSRHTFIEHYVTKNVILPKRSIYDSKMFEELLEEDEILYYVQIRDWYIEIQKEYNKQVQIYNDIHNREVKDYPVQTQAREYIEQLQLQMAHFKTTDEEAEACLAALSNMCSTDMFHHNTLLYMKLINRLAKEHEIRVVDVEALIYEYITGIKYVSPINNVFVQSRNGPIPHS